MVLLIKAIGTPNVGLALDSWNWHFGGGTPDLIQSMGGNQVITFSIADAMPGTTLDGLSEEQRVMPCEEGIVDVVPMLEVLRDAEFGGPVILAPHPNCFTDMKRDAIVEDCRSTFNKLWAAAGLTKSGKMATANA